MNLNEFPSSPSEGDTYLIGNVTYKYTQGVWAVVSQVKTNFRAIIERLCKESGLNMVSGSFDEGATVTNPADVIWDEFSGKYYSWSGAFPKVVSPSSTPATAGGVGVGAWSDKTDLMLKGNLAADDSDVLIAGEKASHVAYATRVIDNNSPEENSASIDAAISLGAYRVKLGQDIKTDGQLENSYTRNDRTINGDYEYRNGSMKLQNECFGTFESAATLSVIARDTDKEHETQILGASTGQSLASYDGVDTAALYLENNAQPAVAIVNDTSFTGTSFTSTEIISSYDSIRVGMVVTAQSGTSKYYGLITNKTSSSTYEVDGWFMARTGTQGIPAAASTVSIQPTARVWGENIVVAIDNNASASSAVCSEMMVNLTKAGSGGNTQILKAINNNLAGITALSAYEAIGLFARAFWAREGAKTALLMENASNVGAHSVQNGDSYQNAVAFKSSKVSSAAYGADVAFQSLDSNIGLQVVNAASRAIAVRTGESERFIVYPNGTLYQILGVAENTLAAQFGISANTGLTVYQSSGTGAAYGATVRVGKISTNNRSINTAGTVNTSGADYAEYVLKNETCGVINKGDICGIDENGELTDKFSQAISFIVKSTDPSFVGGDGWFTETEPDTKTAAWYVWKEELENLAKLFVPINPDPVRTIADDEEWAEIIAKHNASKLIAEQTNTQIKEQYNALMLEEPDEVNEDWLDWEARKEAARSRVDRVAFAGQVPVNVDAKPGEYVIPCCGDSDKITSYCVANPSFDEYIKSLGKVISSDSGVTTIIVKVC